MITRINNWLVDFSGTIFSTFTRYTWFGGRSDRKEFINLLCFAALIFVLGRTIDVFVFDFRGLIGPAIFTATLFFALPLSSLIIRRLHDTNKSGWRYGGYLLFSCVCFFWGVIFRAEDSMILFWITIAAHLTASASLLYALLLHGNPTRNSFGNIVGYKKGE